MVANHEHVIHGWNYHDGHFCEYCIGNLITANGLINKPFDKMAEFSLALHIDFESSDKIEYSFSILQSILKNDGKIVCAPVFDVWTESSATDKHLIEEKVNVILNKLFRTNMEYKVLPEYKIVSLD